MLVIIISFRFMIQREAIRLQDSFFINDNFDDLVKSQNLDGFEKCSRSRRANPEE